MERLFSGPELRLIVGEQRDHIDAEQSPQLVQVLEAAAPTQVEFGNRFDRLHERQAAKLACDPFQQHLLLGLGDALRALRLVGHERDADAQRQFQHGQVGLLRRRFLVRKQERHHAARAVMLGTREEDTATGRDGSDTKRTGKSPPVQRMGQEGFHEARRIG